MRSRRSSATVSSKVRSGWSVITATTCSVCRSSGETLPPRGFGAALLLLFQRILATNAVRLSRQSHHPADLMQGRFALRVEGRQNVTKVYCISVYRLKLKQEDKP